ncbi:MAG: hypothetical protein LBT12_02665 [Oscillospiraceae bacterium]|jgi:hypothetical protein|nr:hypothetical protein [Oscillospiraceae bacterium]
MKLRNVAAITLAGVFIWTAWTLGTRAGVAQDDAPAAERPIRLAGVRPVYTLRPYNGKVAVFSSDFAERPAIETDIGVAGLRAHDRALVEAGIAVSEYDEVLALLEDLGA